MAYLFTKILYIFFYIYHWLAHRDIKEALRKRPGLGY